jgi:pyridoxine kinase
MPVALILSSYVAASRIGGGAQQFALAEFGVDPVLVPTVLFGASPAKGGRGRATDPELFAQLLEGVETQGLLGRVDLVLTGHFSSPEQVEMAAGLIGRIRAADRPDAFRPEPLMVVDPILGDAPKGLYVKPEVAEALAARLLPLADWITPNLWELSHLSGREVVDAAGVVDAARRLGKPTLATSVPGAEGEIGLLCCTPQEALLFAHTRRENVPNGTGDLVTAAFGASLVKGLSAEAAAEGAAMAVAEALAAAAEAPCPVDLPLIALGERLTRPVASVRAERIA